MKLNNFFKLVIAIAVSEFAGLIGSVFTISAIPTWYAGLVKPALNPSAWVFGPVWTTLYALMGIAFFLVWKQHSHILKNVRMLQIWKIGLMTFFIQLFLNAIWSIIFFGLHSSGWALVDIIFLWFAIIWTIIVFYKISKPAAYLLLPYILWVSFAGYLNYSIWVLNQKEPVVCTMEAKLCPDGSYAARIPPKCEFALCPKEDLIQVESPRANEVISSPLIIKGKARGLWFFEASFPVILTDWDGRIIAQGIATAEGEWMTENFVPFEVALKFEKPASIKGVVNRGSLILKKDNPSGLPENDDALEIPVFY